MRKSKIQAKLRDGQPARLAMMGCFLPPFIAYAAHAGYDGIWLDLEHRAMNPREIETLLAFFHHYDIDCILRPPTKEKGELYRYLEDGVTGLVIPLVDNAQAAEELVRKVRFPPLGDRSVAGFGFEANFGLDGSAVQFIEHANHETLLWVQIETPEAMRNVEAIAAVPGVDGLYIGPGDMGIRMALEPGENRLDHAQVMQRVAAACARHGKVWGSFATVETHLTEQLAYGARLLMWGIDFMMLKDGLARGGQTLDRLLG